MADLLPTTAPLWGWLREALEVAEVYAFPFVQNGHNTLHLTHATTRYGIVRAIHEQAKRLNNPTLDLSWVEIAVLQGRLSDDQAARIVACALSVLEDPSKPSEAAPVGVLEAWELRSDKACWDRQHIVPASRKSRRYWYSRAYTVRYGQGGGHGDWYVSMDGGRTHGPETGPEGRAAADLACRSLDLDGRKVRLLLMEEITL